MIACAAFAKKVARLLLATTAFGAIASARAQNADDSISHKPKLSYEADLNYSYVGDAKTKLNERQEGNVSEQSSLVHFVVSPQWGEGPLYRFGLELQRFSFGLPRLAPFPNTLQAVNAVVGVDLQLFDSWLVRVEAAPGFYGGSSDLRSSDFNVPFIIGGSYIAGANLQWILGLSIDVNREYPVIPAIGVRWSFLDRWVLDAVLPTPRLEFEWSKSLTLFTGADIKDGTFRVSGDLGTNQPRLNNAIVEYAEIRVGGGLSWKLASGVIVEVDGGYMPYREFDFHRAGKRFETQQGAAYGQVSLDAKF